MAARRPLWPRIGKWVAILLAALVVLVLALILGLDTGPGKRFIGSQLAGYSTASGVNVRVRDIEGSIYGKMVLRGLEVRDQKGVFLTSPAVAIDWNPFAYLHSTIDLHAVSAGEIDMLRNPVLKPVPSDPNAPTIPDIDLTLGSFRVDRFILEPPVTGQRHIIRLAAGARIADQRAQLSADAVALVAPGVRGGDRLHLRLDAVPDRNRLLIDVKLDGPAGGVIDSYAKLGKALSLTVGGQGDWTAWHGRASGTLGGQALADLGVSARDGSFHVLGDVHPALILTGPAARLVAPAVHVDATTSLAARKADTQVRLSSAAFTARAAGLLDFAASRFGQFKVDARLLAPGAIADNLAGRNVAVSAVLDGKFATPTIAYRASADSIAFGATGVEGLLAQGSATIAADKILVPVHATARRVTGLNAAAGGLVTNLKVDGDIAYAKGQVFADNLHLRSDRIDATALILADLPSGKYTGALKGRVNDYDIDGLGRINLVTDAKLVTAPGGGFGVKGRVRIVTTTITNASLATQLGGNAVIVADIGYDPKAGATVSGLTMTAPDLRVTDGAGSYRLSDGAIGLRANAWSRAYGPATVTATGTIAKPLVTLKAARPGVGIGLVDLTATLSGSAAGYEVHAGGGSNYGPFTAAVLIRAGNGPLAIDVRQLLVAGVTARGTIAQTAAGPFAGTLAIGGPGLAGQVRLAAAGASQRADVDLTANGTRLPGTTPITIGSGLVRATLVMLSGGPSVSGSAAVADLRYDTVLIRNAQARVNYADGRGHGALRAAGTSSVPFDIAAQANFTPDRILANLSGSANGIAFHLAQPALATKAGGDYVLQPATLVLPQGQVEIAGRYGASTEVHARLDGMDLSISQAFAPTLGLGGKATGTLDLTMANAGAIPDARVRLDIAGFTRTGALVVSDPVDVAMLGTLGGNGGAINALIKRGGMTIGRVQARIPAIPAGASLSTRILDAPIAGGIRYNGPAEVLWTLTGIGGQTLAGPIAIGADLSGRVDAPQVTGVIRANALRYENEAYGTTISNIAIDGRFTQSRFQLDSFSGKAGPGTLQASGSVGIDAADGFPIDIIAKLDHAQLADSDAAAATVSGTVAITSGKAAGGLIKGDLHLLDTRYEIVRQGAAEVPELTGIRRKGAPPVEAAAAGPAPTKWKLDVRIRADNQLFVTGMGLDSEWKTDMHIGGAANDPSVVGKLQVVRGTFTFSGRRLDLEDSSAIQFNGPMLNPDLNISADTTVESVTATINIGGTATKPQISFTSTPTLPQDEVLSRLLFGSSVTSLTPMQGLQLAAALNSLRGSGGGLNPIGKLRGASGLSNLSVLGADKATGRGTAVSAGKYISNRIYVEVIADAKGFTQTQLTIGLSKALSILTSASTGGLSSQSVALKYSRQY
ncbi:MAG TPA: translocation/assembly module TamB domain-containing protein [Sphingomonas sp.]